jgi:hypothetical protein
VVVFSLMIYCQLQDGGWFCARVTRRGRDVLSQTNGRDGNYLFELEAQPGGPLGRSIMKAGSRPNTLARAGPGIVRPFVLFFGISFHVSSWSSTHRAIPSQNPVWIENPK